VVEGETNKLPPREDTMSYTNEYRIERDNGMFWGWTGWTAYRPNAEVFTSLKDLPKEIDGLAIERHDNDPSKPDVRYYWQDEVEAQAWVKATEVYTDDDQDDE
jgi:hypothetical protein